MIKNHLEIKSNY